MGFAKREDDESQNLSTVGKSHTPLLATGTHSKWQRSMLVSPGPWELLAIASAAADPLAGRPQMIAQVKVLDGPLSTFSFTRVDRVPH